MSIEFLSLSTARLTLIRFSADFLRLALTDRETLEQRLSACFLPQWHTEPQLRVLNGVLPALEAPRQEVIVEAASEKGRIRRTR